MKQNEHLSLNSNERKSFCSCGNVLEANETCECKKFKRSAASDSHVSSTRKFNEKTRPMILKRDGTWCQRCVIKYGLITTENIQIHHIKPQSKYNGTNGYPDLRHEPTNLVPLCQPCNLAIGTAEELDFPFEIENQDWVL